MLQSLVGTGVGVGVGVEIGVGVGVGVGVGLWSWPSCPLIPLLLPLLPLLPLLVMETGVGDGVGEGVRTGICVVETVDVVNLGLAPVPRTHAKGGVQGLLAEMLLPSALQELLAACTSARRRLFKPVCREAVPWEVFEARGDTGEHAVDDPPFRSWGRPSMLVDGIRAALEEVGTLKLAGIGFALVELPTSMVTAPGGRIDAPTTSARNKFRVPCAIAREVSIYTGCIPLASHA